MLPRVSSRALHLGAQALRPATRVQATAAVATRSCVSSARAVTTFTASTRPAVAAAAPRRCLSSDASATPAAAAAATAAPSDDPIVVESHEGGVSVIRFNRPSSLNAMTVRMGEQFETAIKSLSQDTNLRCVVLTGTGKAFSAGGDLDFLLSRCDSTPHVNSVQMRAFYARFLCLLRLPVPIIAAINGPAIGAGACVAAACDLRIAAKGTDIGFTFSKLGLHPGMGCTHTLPALIGQQNASRLLLTGEIIKGQRALEMGLVGEVVEEAADVLPAALQLASSIAANSTVAIRTLTTSLRLVHEQDMERALWREADAQAQCYATPELRATVAAMMAKSKSKAKKA